MDNLTAVWLNPLLHLGAFLGKKYSFEPLMHVILCILLSSLIMSQAITYDQTLVPHPLFLKVEGKMLSQDGQVQS